MEQVQDRVCDPDQIQIPLPPILCDGKFYNLTFGFNPDEIHYTLVPAWIEVVVKGVEAALRKGTDLTPQTLAEAVAKLIIPSDLAKPPLDQIEEEALDIAEQQIIVELSKDGLPPPKSIRDHAKQLLLTNPDLLRRARLRLEARYQVVAETL